jgi:hypothetical protein
MVVDWATFVCATKYAFMCIPGFLSVSFLLSMSIFLVCGCLLACIIALTCAFRPFPEFVPSSQITLRRANGHVSGISDLITEAKKRCVIHPPSIVLA